MLSRSLVALLAIAAVSPAVAQQDDSGADTMNSPVSLRCSAVSEIDEAQRASIVYYIAGYHAAERALMTIATVGESNEAAGDATGSPSTQAGEGTQSQSSETTPDRSPASASNVVPTLSMEGILAACAQSPDSRVIDIVVAHGGATTN